MHVPGDPYDECLAGLLEQQLERAGGPLEVFDAHTHLGQNDPDGRTATPEEILAGLDRAGQRRALIFPMQEPGGYTAANDAAAVAAAGSAGRLTALARLDPNLGDAAVAEGERMLAAGAAGFKLHPRSDAFDIPHPVVERIVALAGEHRAPVLFHAGRGFPGLGVEVAELAARHPGARLILAHAGISDLGHLAGMVAEAPNIFFDTSWWLVSDMLMLFTSVPPGRILYASDMPYGCGRYSLLRDLRCAAQVGLDRAALESIAGGQLARILAGEEPADLGPAPGTAGLGARDLLAEQGIAYLATACQLMFREGDPTEPLSLARLALRDSARPEARQADELCARALEAHLADPGNDRSGLYAAMGAQLVLGTPGRPERTVGSEAMDRCIAHLDIDAFYASVELLRRPELKGLPVIVSGSGPRAVVTTASYEARRFGIGSAMPTSRARRLCPDAVLIPPDFTAYREASGKVMALVRRLGAEVEQAGLDEAYIDLTGMLSPRAAMRGLVNAIRTQTGLTASVGIGPNKLVAKVSSDAEKPAGFVVLSREGARERFAGAPPGLVPGIGPKTAERLARMGITTLGALAAFDEEALAAAFGPRHGRDLVARARFEHDGVVSSVRVAKSESRETTFDVDVHDTAEMEGHLLRLANELCERLARQDRRGRTVSIKVRLDDWTTVTRARSLDRAVNEPPVVREVALELFRAYAPTRPVRLLGVQVAGLDRDAATPAVAARSDPGQLALPL